MGQYIKKPWGSLKKVELAYPCNGDAAPNLWVARMMPESGTSIHRHDCDSAITCIDGILCVSCFGSGDAPDFKGIVDGACASSGGVFIPARVWHRIYTLANEATDGRQTVFHEWYDLKDSEDDYPIERYEGAVS